MSVEIPFAHRVQLELRRARKKHGAMQSDPHAWAVIQEELDEFRDAYRAQPKNTIAMLTELIHTAAMCQRAAEDLHLVKQEQL